MKHNIIASCMLLFALVFSSVKTYAETPVEFNDRLVSILDSVTQKSTEWGEKLKDAVETKNYKQLTPYRVAVQKYIDRKILELQKTKGVGKGAPEFVKTMAQFLTFEKKVVNAFTPFEKFTSATTDEEFQKAVETLQTEAQSEAEELKKVNAAQESYAAKNDFTVEEAKPEEKEAQ